MSKRVKGTNQVCRPHAGDANAGLLEGLSKQDSGEALLHKDDATPLLLFAVRVLEYVPQSLDLGRECQRRALHDARIRNGAVANETMGLMHRLLDSVRLANVLRDVQRAGRGSVGLCHAPAYFCVRHEELPVLVGAPGSKGGGCLLGGIKVQAVMRIASHQLGQLPPQGRPRVFGVDQARVVFLQLDLMTLGLAMREDLVGDGGDLAAEDAFQLGRRAAQISSLSIDRRGSHSQDAGPVLLLTQVVVLDDAGIWMVLFGVVGLVEDEQVDAGHVDEAAVEAIEKDLGGADNHHVVGKLLFPEVLCPHHAGHFAMKLGNGMLKVGPEHTVLLEA